MIKWFLVPVLLLGLFFETSVGSAESPNSKMKFWATPKKGANIFNKVIIREDIKAAKQYGIAFIRLAPDKFISSKKDFLIGDAGHYDGLVKEDLAKLTEILDIFAEEEMPVVLTFLSLPGARWEQNNGGKKDLRLWKDKKYQDQAVSFWKAVAKNFKDHPAIVGYNILNEPLLERVWESEGELYLIQQKEVQSALNSFYTKVVSGIRMIDPDIPIILDSSSRADPRCFENMIPLKDKNVLYSFHMYEPYSYTNYRNYNKGRYTYPGLIPDIETNKTIHWDSQKLEDFLKPVFDFQKRNNICGNRILVGEFGGHRTSKGLSLYFQDLINIFQKNKWHFAFYAFREDTWDGMDYELGDKKLPWTYWEALKKGEKPTLNRSGDTRTFKVLRGQNIEE